MISVNEAEGRFVGTRLFLVRLGWVFITLTTLFLFLLAIPSEYQARMVEGAGDFGPSLAYFGIPIRFYSGFRTFMDISLALVFCAIGIVLYLRKSTSRVVIFTSIAMETFGPFFVPSYYFLAQARPDWSIPVAFVRALGLAASLIIFCFMIPDGQFIPHWTRRVSLIWGLTVLAWFLFPNMLANLVYMKSWSSNLALSFTVYAVAYGSGIYAQIYRYRKFSSPVQRQQTKWYVIGTSIGFLGFILYYSPLVFLPGLFNHPGMYRLLHIFFGIPIFHLCIIMIPLFTAISITRYRLWDIDHLINRALIAGMLTVVLILVFSVTVLLLTQMLLWVSGGSRNNLVIAIATLFTTLLFNPLRHWTQDIIDQRFYRKRYNSEQTLTAMSITLQDELDLRLLLNRLVSIVQHTFQPAHVTLWLIKRGSKENPQNGGSIDTSTGFIEVHETDPIIAFIQANPAILPVEKFDLESPTLSSLRQAQVKLVVPLVGQGQLIGLINLGPRLSEQDYSIDDFHLINILSSQAAPALRVAQLVQQQQAEIVRREQAEYEMNVARQIQLGFLPKQLPDLENWQIASHYQPAREVGGDFYDFRVLPDGRLAIIIGDVSGHGVPSALLMVNIVSVLRDATRLYNSPGEILQYANGLLYSEFPPSMFATCLFAILDPSSGAIIYSNAGHNLPMRWADGKLEELWASGLPLGIMEEVRYDEYQANILVEEKILFFSDGLVEAHDSYREMFGEERIKQILAKHTSSAQGLIDDLMHEMSAYIGPNTDQEDDVTILALHRTAPVFEAIE
jgi:serine phosphatase RsbU (regulator of sigma subunit)